MALPIEPTAIQTLSAQHRGSPTMPRRWHRWSRHRRSEQRRSGQASPSAPPGSRRPSPSHGIGTAAVGATAEKPEIFGSVLILTVIPETIVIFGLVVALLLII